MVLRVLGGRFRGSVLAAPPDTAFRPTSARRRQAVFDILRAQVDGFEHLHVVDLFAGTGAVGFEALSEGAAHVTFVENDPAAAKLIRRNAEALGVTGQVTLLRNDATRLGPPRTRADVAFLDPPYAQGFAEKALRRLLDQGWLTEDAIVLVELAKADPFTPPQGLTLARTYRHGAGHLLRLHPNGRD